MNESQQNDFTLNDANLIISVGPKWDQFALENDAPGALATHVIGREIWDFVSGFPTKSYLNAILFACRMDTQGFNILYRCDAPHVRRLFRLSIQPENKGALKLNHTLVHSKKIFETSKVLAFTDHYDCTRCSVCCSFLVGENWIDTASLPDERYFPKSFGICPECRHDAIRAIQRETRSEGLSRLTSFQNRPRK